ncbi:hypothetical protein HPY26_07620 [Methylorubrum rhodesianum]|uniref:hypothetical protein n=1 Tax=Methylorubrum rhodesianum TaxID=29427 RepID=UPI00190B4D47|nr:hypothetical protein [Methylorubrum rhodesianum]MBK3402663.1 hypothetical protein [Methylorubrum rhodesianum]
MKSLMHDLFLSCADGARIEAWQIGDRTVSEDEARRRLSAIELSSDDWVSPKGGEPGDREALDLESFGAQAWTAEQVLFTIGTYEGGMWVYGAPRHPPGYRRGKRGLTHS